MDFFSFIMFEILSASWICMFPNFCQIWEVFSSYFFEYFFSPTLFLLSDDMNVRSFVIVPQVPERFCSFFSFLVYITQIGNFYLSAFTFFCPPHSADEPHYVSYFVIVFLASKIFPWFFFVFVFFLCFFFFWLFADSFYFFIISNMFIIARQSIFMMAFLKSLPDNSNTWHFSVGVCWFLLSSFIKLLLITPIVRVTWLSLTPRTSIPASPGRFWSMLVSCCILQWLGRQTLGSDRLRFKLDFNTYQLHDFGHII